ncbi:hypothetical protein IFM89_035345 [Coptis chinensis]|uniref:RNase H type-1 domain-containing protein n=1 Tax=Coptis chinensis TaxID=261450 RepID=A0A835LCJ4_9MAGN|nr:hypothetical protein IFM89_035345 [Coptis chinensis]
MKDITHILCIWSKPAAGRVKLDVDGSVGQGHSGFGGIIWDEMGSNVLAYTGYNTNDSVVYQELLAIKEGLQACKMMNYAQVEVASDSLRVVQAIKRMEEPLWFCMNVLESIFHLVPAFDYVESIFHLV